MSLRLAMLSLWASISVFALCALAQTAGSASPQPAVNAAVSGTISDEKGTGVAGAVVTAEGAGGFTQSATTDGQGQYAIQLPAGSYSLSVAASGAKIFQATVTLSPSQVLTLGAGGAIVAQTNAGQQTATASASAATSAAPAPAASSAITGTINDQTGAPVASATIAINGGNGFTKTATTDGQGLYAVELPGGSYNVSVTAGGVKVFQAEATLSPGQVLTLGVAGALVAQASSAPAAVQNAAAAPTSLPGAAIPPPPIATPQVVLSAPQTSTASNGKGSISGNVTDQTGAVLVGATVKISSAAGVVATTAADEKGNYSFKDLPPGSYTLTVSQPAFKDFVASNITLGAGVQLPLDASLEPAGEKTEVNVSGQTVGQVETATAEVSGTITQKEVTTLGLNGRNFTQLIALTPGVSNQTGQDEAKVGVVGSVKYSVNGGRVEYNTFEVDGSDVLNAGLNGAESTLMVYPSLDAIQEVKVLTSNYGAMYGRTASGTVMVTTKSGGNSWHGDAYEFIRNEFFNARNYFDQTTKAPKYRRNDFGGTLGGPIKKNKAYIFWSEEFRFENSPSDQHPNFNHGVPSLAEREGDFSDVCPTLPSGGTGTFLRAQWPDCPSQGTTGQPDQFLTFPDNNVFSSPGVPSGVGAALLSSNLIPLPNAAGGCNSSIGSCYDAVISEPTRWREELGNLDYNINSQLQLSLRGIHDSWSTTVPVPQWQLVDFQNISNSFPSVQNRFVGPGVSLVVHLTDTIRPTLLNQIEASFTNSHITLRNVNGPGGANYERPASLGIPGGPCNTIDVTTGPPLTECPLGAIFDNGFGGKAPGIVVSGNNLEYGGSGFVADPSYMPFVHTNPSYSLRDGLSLVIGKHTVQGGIQAIYAQRNETNPAVGAASGDVQGLLTFTNEGSAHGSVVPDTGNAFADIISFYNSPTTTNIYDRIRSYTQDSAQFKYYNSYWIEEPYLQDDWKLNSRLTLNLGVRFSLFGLWQEKYHQAYNWTPSTYSPALAAQVQVDPTSGQLLSIPQGNPIPINLANPDPRITNGIVRCGVNGVPNGCMTNHLFNPVPRVGFAWDPFGNGKTSIRAGYGMFYEHGTGEESNTGSLEGSAPNVLTMTQNLPNTYGCIGSFSTGVEPTCTTQAAAYPLDVTAIPTKAVWPYSQQWSLSAQRELPGSMVATVAYVGSKGTHLTVERQINQLRPISDGQNPFAINEPIVPAGDCGNYNGQSFTLSNRTSIPQGTAAFYNLEAACFGQTANAQFPDVNTLRPYPGLGLIFSLQNGADSSYHAFQTTLRRTRGPFTIGGSYTYSHSIDDSSDRSDATFVNSYDLRSNKASSNFDERHLLNISYIYTLPDLSKALARWTTGVAGQPVGDGADTPSSSAPSRVLRSLGDGWQISGITVFQSGTPFSVINQASAEVSVDDNAGVANGIGAGSYPDLNPHPGPTPNERYNTESFGPLLGNPNLFVAPRGLTFGDAGRNFLNNPHRTNFDLSLLKHFPIREESVLEFRAEAFNVFNHTQFRIYNADLGNTGSNSISCYGGPNYSAGFQGPTVDGVITGTDCVTGNAFLHPVDAHRPRTIQFGLKLSF